MAATMFQRYGGFTTVSKIVSAFYDKILDSPLLSPYFDGVDMRKQIDHQTKFISYLMGGPVSYSDEALERVHARLNIDQKSFDEIVMLLAETLEDHGVEQSDVSTLRQELVRRSKIIINRN